MAKSRPDRSRRDPQRASITHLAARIMAQDGIDDFGIAKRKAARQAGLPDDYRLPSNEEVEEALRAYRQIYSTDAEGQQLAQMRREALRVMRRFARFHPHLTGPVLSGLAGKYSNITLQLFADDSKEVELFLINEGLRYQTGEIRLLVNDQEKSVPTFTIVGESAEIRLVVLWSRDQRHPVRHTAAGRIVERASLAAVEQLTP